MAVKVTKKLINDALRPLRGKTPDQIAELVKEKVGKTYCRNSDACAVAQFVANQLPQGMLVEVDGPTITVYAATPDGNRDWDTELTVDLPQRVTQFINNFDELKYPELVITDDTGHVLRNAEGVLILSSYGSGSYNYLRIPDADTSASA